MDFISAWLSLVPVPCLGSAVSIFSYIWSAIQRVQLSKRQLNALATSIAQLLQTLDVEIRSGRGG
jgi:hypothetical protein